MSNATRKEQKAAQPETRDKEHNYLRLLCASNVLKPYLEADLNSHKQWSNEIDEFLSAVDALQVSEEAAQ